MIKNCCIVIFLLLTLSLSAQDNSPRRSQLFNFDWKFSATDVADARRVDFNDATWESLDLPHDFQINQPWNKDAGGARGFKEMGVGWYRKTFKADASWKGKRVLLDFEGRNSNNS